MKKGSQRQTVCFRRAIQADGPAPADQSSCPTPKVPCLKPHVNSALIRSHRRTGRITKWRQSHKSPNQFATSATELSEEQKLIKRLQKELKDAQLDQTAEAARYLKIIVQRLRC